jgi:hypothetical protein
MNSLCRFDSFCRLTYLFGTTLAEMYQIVSNHEITQRGGDIESKLKHLRCWRRHIDIEECQNPKAPLGARELQPKLP